MKIKFRRILCVASLMAGSLVAVGAGAQQIMWQPVPIAPMPSIQIGNSTIGPNGSSAYQAGNVIAGSNGTSYYRSGNTAAGTDGSRVTRIGDTIVITAPDGRRTICNQIGNNTVCN